MQSQNRSVCLERKKGLSDTDRVREDTGVSGRSLAFGFLSCLSYTPEMYPLFCLLDLVRHPTIYPMIGGIVSPREPAGIMLNVCMIIWHPTVTQDEERRRYKSGDCRPWLPFFSSSVTARQAGRHAGGIRSFCEAERHSFLLDFFVQIPFLFYPFSSPALCPLLSCYFPFLILL